MQRAYRSRGLSFLPKLTLALTIGLAASTASYAQNVYTPPVGFINVPVTNVSGGYNTFALPFQQLNNDQGAVTVVSGPSNITVNCATCASTNYALPGALNYVIFNTGNALGHSYAIASNSSAGALTLVTGGDNLTTIGGTGVQVGDSYSIQPYFRVVDVFGPATGGVLSNGTAATKADNVLVWNGAAFTTYWPKNTGLWQGGTNPNGTDPLLPDESVLVLRRSANPTNIVAIGGVRVTNLVTQLEVGYNLIGNSYPASTVVSNMNLIGSGSGFQGGSAATKSDQILVWNGSAYDQLWYKTNSTPNSWQGGNGLAGAYPILPSSTYFVLLQHGTAGDWPRPLPYSP